MAGSSTPGAAKKVLLFLFIFGIVCYMGFQDLRFHRETQERNAELDSIYKELQVARHGKEELERIVAELTAEKNELTLLKSNTSSQLVKTEMNKRELADEKVKLEELVVEREKQIEGLKDQLEAVQDSAKEAKNLKKRVHELEEQLELFKANTTVGSSSQSLKHEESSQEKKQGEDLEHGLSAADKTDNADDQSVGVEEVDDRKREQGGGDEFEKSGETEGGSEGEGEAEAEAETGGDSSAKDAESEVDPLNEDLDAVKAAAIR